MATDPLPEASAVAPRRIGILGGTFDPPHNGHVSVARDVADALHLDRLLWIPAGEPPHKSATTPAPARIRLEMTRAAAESDSRFEVRTDEIEREGPSYTVDTLRELREEFEGDELFLVIGVDQFRDFDSWRAPDEIARLAYLAVMDRGGTTARDMSPHCLLGVERMEAGQSDALPALPAIVFVPVRRIDVSSTDVRDRFTLREDVADLLPPGVLAIAERESLYRL